MKTNYWMNSLIGESDLFEPNDWTDKPKHLPGLTWRLESQSSGPRTAGSDLSPETETTEPVTMSAATGWGRERLGKLIYNVEIVLSTEVGQVRDVRGIAFSVMHWTISTQFSKDINYKLLSSLQGWTCTEQGLTGGKYADIGIPR